MDPVITRVAHAGYTDHRYFGASVFDDLLERESLTGMIALSVAGRRLDVEERSTLDSLAVGLSVADPRIWPLKLTRLVASYGSTVAGVVAGQLCVEGDLIGPWSAGAAASQFVELRAALDAAGGATPERETIRAWLAGKKRLVGYGIAFRERDERVDALTPHLAARGRTALPAWCLMESLAEVTVAERGLRPNMAALLAAVLLDMKFPPDQIAAIAHFLTINTFIAHGFEGAAQQAPAMRELPVESIDYVGPPPRVSPRAR